MEQTLPQIREANHFSKLDANSEFLADRTGSCDCLITPVRRFCFHQLPFGIMSAPEHFQRKMAEILGDIEGVVCLVDNILVSGITQEEHDGLMAVLTRLSKAGITLGLEKREINKRSVKFLSQLVDEDEVKPDPNELHAIQQMKTPSTVSELRQFLGIVNQQSKFCLT